MTIDGVTVDDDREARESKRNVVRTRARPSDESCLLGSAEPQDCVRTSSPGPPLGAVADFVVELGGIEPPSVKW